MSNQQPSSEAFMNDLRKMIRAAREALVHVLDTTAEDRVLVVTDEATRLIGEAFARAAEEIGARSEMVLLPESERPLEEPTADMLSALGPCTVVINAFVARSEETPFRIRWIRAVLEGHKRRLGHAPGITPDMMISGPMNIDYAELVRNAEAAIRAFDNAATVHITAPAGTDIELNIEDRPFQSDVHITTEHFGNLPCGEIWCAPVEDGANGVIVCDGSIGDLGKVPAPLRIEVKEGRIVNLQSDDASLVEKVWELSHVDDEASVVGELGIGLNPGARITGNLLEDEKAFRTAHIAFGNNEDMIGGRNRSKTHRDFLFHRPTIEVTYKDGSRRTLMRDGELILPSDSAGTS